MSIRELLLIAMVLAICAAAFVRPKYGLFGYLWYGLMRPDVLAWVEDERNIYSMVILGATALSSIRSLDKVHRLGNTITGVLLLLQLPIALSVLAAFSTDLAMVRYTLFIKMFVALLLIPILIETEQEMRELLIVIGLSLGFVGLKYGLYGVIFGGVELARGYGPMLADNNFVALGLVTVIPICWYGRALSTNQAIRTTLLSFVLFSIPAIIMTNSRGGILTLGVVMLFILKTSKSKLTAVFLLGACAAGAVYLVQDMFVNRMSTLTLGSTQQEASAASRMDHLEIVMRMWRDHPVLGVGFGGVNYAFLSSRYGATGALAGHVAHNSYAQMLVDSGIFAFLLYTGILIYAFVWLMRSRKRMKVLFPDDAARAAIPTGLLGALLAFMVDSTFYSCQRIDLPYILLLTIGTWQLIERNLIHSQNGAKPAPAPRNLAYVPIKQSQHPLTRTV